MRCVLNVLARRIVPKFDAFQDNPWPIIYRFLDKEYPGSKFILTIRPSDKWIGSVTDHFSKGRPPMREWIYGPGKANPIGNEAVYVERYERHNREVIDELPDPALDVREDRGEPRHFAVDHDGRLPRGELPDLQGPRRLPSRDGAA